MIKDKALKLVNELIAENKALKAALAQPAQPISLTSVGYIADEDDDIQVYQRPWVGLTEAQFLEAARLAENGNYLVAFVRIQEWLKEQNT